MKQKYYILLLLFAISGIVKAQPQNEYVFIEEGSCAIICNVKNSTSTSIIHSFTGQFQSVKKQYSVQDKFFIDYTGGPCTSLADDYTSVLLTNKTAYTTEKEYLDIYWSPLADPTGTISNGGGTIGKSSSPYNSTTTPYHNIEIDRSITFTEAGPYTGTDVKWYLTYSGGDVEIGTGHTLTKTAKQLGDILKASGNIGGYYTKFIVESRVPYYDVPLAATPATPRKSYRGSYMNLQMMQIVPIPIQIITDNAVGDQVICGTNVGLRITTRTVQNLKWQVGQFNNNNDNQWEWVTFSNIFTTITAYYSQFNFSYNDIKDEIANFNKNNTIGLRAVFANDTVFPFTEIKGGFEFYNSAPTFSYAVSNSCPNANNGAIEINPSYSTEDQVYNFFKYNSQTNQYISAGITALSFTSADDKKTTPKNIIPNTYYVEGSYDTPFGLRCKSGYTSIVVGTATLPVITATKINDVICYGDNNGKISYTVSGGTTPYATPKLWKDGVETTKTPTVNKEFTGLSAGTYKVKVTDNNGNGCTAESIQITIAAPQSQFTVSLSPTNVSCHSTNLPSPPLNKNGDGKITITTTGGLSGSGTFKYEYETSPSVWASPSLSSTKEHLNLSPKVHSYRITDTWGCIVLASATVGQPLAIAASTTVTNQICNYTDANASNQPANGTITINASNGNGGFTYLLNGSINPTTGSRFEGLRPGTNNYTIKVTDAKGCVFTTPYVPISNYTNPSLGTNITSSSVACYGASTGSITIPAISKGTSGQLQSISLTGTNSSSCNTTQNPFNSTSKTFSNLKADTYTIEVSDIKGCQASVSKPVGGVTSALTVTAYKVNDVICHGTTTGKIRFTVSGGTNTYATAKLWKDGVISSKTPTVTKEFTGLSAGTYTVKVTDNNGNGCTSESNTITIAEYTNPVLIQNNYTVTNKTCSYNTGSIVISDTSGIKQTSNIEAYYLTGGQISGTRREVDGDFDLLQAATNYNLYVKDANGCLSNQISNIPITGPSSLSFSTLIIVNQTCNWTTTNGQAKNGSIEVAAAGGTGAKTFKLTGGGLSNISPNQNNIFANLQPATNYVITITDGNTCTASSSPQTINNYTNPSILPANINAVNVACSGGTGSIIITNINKGTSGILQSISATGAIPTNSTNSTQNPFNATSKTFSGLIADYYKIKVTDVKGCKDSIYKNVSQPTPLLITASKVQDVICFGANDGKINFIASGGTPNYSFTLYENGNASTKTPLNGEFTGLSAGSYVVRVTDANACFTNSNTVIIESPTGGVIQATLNTTKVSCHASNALPTAITRNNGTITANPTGGWGNFTYALNLDNTYSGTNIFNNLSQGNYTVRVKDQKGCIASFATEIESEDELLITEVLLNDEICADTDTGRIVTSAHGGTPNYSFKVFNNTVFTNQSAVGVTANSPVNFSNLTPSQNYILEVLDVNLCRAAHDFIINPYLNPSIIPDDVLTTHVDCNGNNSGTLNITTINKGTSGQLQTLGIWGAIPNNPGNLVLNPFNGTSTLFTELIADTYTISLSDINGCSDSIFKTVIQPDTLLVSASKVQDVLCFGDDNGIIEYELSGGNVAYQTPTLWKEGSLLGDAPVNNTRFISLAKGNYQVKVIDAKGCESESQHATIEGPDTSISATSTSTIIDCHYNSASGTINNGIIKLSNVTGGYDPINGYGSYEYAIKKTTEANSAYSAFQLSDTFPGLTSDSYTLKIKDSRGCENFTLVEEVSSNPELVVAGTSFDEICEGEENGSIEFSASGGIGTLTYLLSCTEIGLDSLPPNDLLIANRYNSLKPASGYQLTVSDSLHCSQVTNLGELDIKPYTNPSFAPNSVFASPVTCYNESNGSIQASLVEAKKGADTQYFNSFTWLGINKGDTGIIDDFTGPDITLANLRADSYTLGLRDENNCLSVPFTIEVKEPDLFELTYNGKQDVIYKSDNSGVFNLSLHGGNTGSQTISAQKTGFSQQMIQLKNASNFELAGLYAGEYTAIATDGKGCTAQLNNLLIKEPALDLSFVVIEKSDALCKAGIGKFKVMGIGGWGKYEFSGATRKEFHKQTTFNDLYAGNYLVTVKDSMGATFSQRVFIHEPKDSLRVDFIDSLNPTCGNNGLLSMQFNGGMHPYKLSYQAHDTLTVLDPFIYTNNALAAANCTFAVIDSNKCDYRAEATLSGEHLLAIQSISIKSYPTTELPIQNGELEASVSGSDAGTAFEWTKESDNFTTVLSSSLTLNDAPADLYKLSVRNSSGCQLDQYKFLPPANGLPLTVDTLGHETSFGAANGFALLSGVVDTPTTLIVTKNLEVSQSYNLADYPEIYNPTAQKIYLTGLEGGDYIIRLIDTSQRLAYAKFTIIPYNKFEISHENIAHIKQHRGADGAIQVTVSGGAGDNAFTWLNQDNQAMQLNVTHGEHISFISDLLPGTYQLSITDKYTNSIQATYTIQEPDSLQLNIEQTNITCKDSINGYVNLLATGGWGSFQYKIDTARYYNNSSEMFNLGARDITFSVVDKYGVIESVQLALTEPDYLHSYAPIISNVNCTGESTGFIPFEILGGTAPYKFKTIENSLWTIDTLAQNLRAGSYTYIFSDWNNCKGMDTLELVVTEPDSLLFNSFDVEHTKCNRNDGSIALTIKGGTAPYNCLITDSDLQTVSNEPFANNLKQYEQYKVTVLDSNACNIEKDVYINPSSNPLVSQLDITPVQCFGGNNGAAHIIQATAGEPYAPYTITWSNGDVGMSSTHFSKGNQFLVITDTNNCTSTKYFSVTEPDLLSGYVTDSMHVSCYNYNDAYIDVIPTGGVGEYQLLWSNGDTTSLINNLAKGVYTLTITDANFCTNTQLFTLNEPGLLHSSIDFIDSIKCKGDFNGTIGFSFEGGTAPFSFKELLDSIWITDTLAQFVNEGIYTYQFTDAQNCAAIDTIEVNMIAPDSLLFKTFDVSHTTCELNNGALDFSMKGGTAPFTYTIRNNQNEIISQLAYANELMARGQYYIKVEDKKGCEIEKEVYIKPSRLPRIDKLELNRVLCYGDSTGTAKVLETTPGEPFAPFEIKWSNLDTGFYADGFKADIYFVYISDTNGCASERFFTIRSPQPLAATVVDSLHAKCYGSSDGFITIEAKGGVGNYKYKWSTGDNTPTLSNLKKGTYTLTLNDSNSCVYSNSYKIYEPTLLSSKVASIDSLKCKGDADGKIIFAVKGGTQPYFFKPVDTDVWIEDTLVRNVSEGTYSYQFTDAHNCVGKNKLTVAMKSPDSLLFKTIDIKHTTCELNNGSVSFTMKGGTLPYKYSIQDNQLTELSKIPLASELKPRGQYILTVSDKHNCSIREDIYINPSTKPTIDVIGINPVLCYGDTNGMATVLQATPADSYAPFTITWSNNDTGFVSNRFEAGEHYATILDADGCQSVRYFMMTTPQLLVANVIDSLSPRCFEASDGFIMLEAKGGTGSYNYTWSNGDSTATASNLSKGIYEVQLSDSNGCMYVTNFSLNHPAKITNAGLPDELTLCTGQIKTYHLADNWQNSVWKRANGEQIFGNEVLLNEAGFYYVQTHSEKGCEVFDSLKLIVSDNALQADFLLASEAEMGNTVVIIEITYPIAESLVWNFPPEANQIAAHDNYQEIMFSDTGRYYIELTAAAGNCTSTKGKYIEIYDSNDSKKNQAIEAEPSQIQKFEVYPNPATYHLNLSIDLADEKDIVIELIDATGNKLTKVNYTNGLKNYEVTLDVNSLKQGVYMVRLLSGNDVRSKMIVIY